MIPTEDIMDLLKLCLASTYFHYNDNHYKQLHGTAMDHPGPCLNPWSTTTSGLESHNLKLKETSGVLYLYSPFDFFRRLS